MGIEALNGDASINRARLDDEIARRKSEAEVSAAWAVYGTHNGLIIDSKDFSEVKPRLLTNKAAKDE